MSRTDTALGLLGTAPYAKLYYVLNSVSDQASVPRFVERVFGAPALSSLDPAAQDGQANGLMNVFDFTSHALPPVIRKPRESP